MAVIAAQIKIGSWRGNFGKDVRVSFALQIETDDVANGPMAIYASPLIPKVGQYYAVGNEIGRDYICKSVKPKVDDADKCLWEVEVEYEGAELPQTGMGNGDGDENDPRPARLFQVDSTIRYEKVPLRFDADNRPIRNTAGEEFSSPVEANWKILVINISRREFSNPFSRQIRYQDSVNAMPFWGQAPGKVLIESILMDAQSAGNSTTGWNVKYSVAIRPAAQNAGRWDVLTIPSMGFKELKNGKLVEIIDTDNGGKPFNVEQYLDENGRWVDRKSPNFSSYDLHFRVKNTNDFSPLQLPNMASLTYAPQLEEQT